MARETIMICDVCQKRISEGLAKNWISVSPAQGSTFGVSGNYLKPELFGLYCSFSCLKKRIVQIDDFEANPPIVTGIEMDGETIKITGTLMGLPVVESDDFPPFREGDVVFGSFEDLG